ncbi:MAG: NYN domain-containing protein [bacterium]
MIEKFAKGKTIVLIDAANFESSVKYLGWWIDYKKLYLYFINNTNLIGIRHYCVRHDDERQDNFFTLLKRRGYKLITKPLKVITEADKFKGDLRKANFDVEIALDAYSLLGSYDTLVLFSGDSDFDYLVRRLREKNKNVLVVSQSIISQKSLLPVVISILI